LRFASFVIVVFTVLAIGVAHAGVITPIADLQLTITDGADPVIAGGPVQYAYIISNNGPDPASGTLTLSVTSGTITTFSNSGNPAITCITTSSTTATCSFGAIGAAGFTDLIVLMTAPVTGTSMTASGTLTIATGTTDIVPANNSASQTTTIVPPPADLVIASTHTEPATPGQNGFTYAITVSNAGPAPTTAAVIVEDLIPSGLNATTMSGTGWSCAFSTTSNPEQPFPQPLGTCTRSDALAGGASYPPITLVGNVVPAVYTLTNLATVRGGGEMNTVNDLSIDPTTVLAPSLAIPAMSETALLLLAAALAIIAMRAIRS
jgi:uncharacterized repeat protein (TIGR01451 family)